MVLHSEKYQQLIKEKNLKPGRVLSPTAGEYLSGLPRGWTDPTVGACSRADVEKLFPIGQE